MQGQTARFKFRYLLVGESLRNFRADTQANAETNDAALTKMQGFVAQMASLMQGGPGRTQTIIGKDTDGVPYFDPTTAVAQPLQIGLDIDNVPYYIDWSVTV
jgi:hypothetical protein